MDASSESELGRQRLAMEGGPMVHAEWVQPVFLHYAVDPAKLAHQIPAPLELELFDGRAWVTLVAMRMRRFRAVPGASLMKYLFPLVREQRFFNVRTYVRRGDERGLFFPWGWVSSPIGIRWPSRPLGLPCGFASIEYQQPGTLSAVRGEIRAGTHSFRFQGTVDSDPHNPSKGSFAEFALERYSGFFAHGRKIRIFRAWHVPWTFHRIRIDGVEDRLVRERFPWLEGATLCEAHTSPGFETVWMGKPRTLTKPEPHRERASAFFRMP